MNPIQSVVTALAMATALLFAAGPLQAHAPDADPAADFPQHMDEYATEIRAMVDFVDGVVTQYQPGQDFTQKTVDLVVRWEGLEFHEAVESNAPIFYGPVWQAVIAFRNAVLKGEPVASVRDKGQAIAEALWQGYGGLKLMAAQRAEQATQASTAAATPSAAPAAGGDVIATIEGNLDKVLTLYQSKRNEEALKLIQDTYLGYFEGIEGDLIEQDASLVSGLEADFNANLPLLIQNGAAAAEVGQQIDTMKTQLATARTLLQKARAESTPVF